MTMTLRDTGYRRIFTLLLCLIWFGCDAPPSIEYNNPHDPLNEEAVPLPPANVSVQTISASGYQITWTDQSSFADGYLIERYPGPQGAARPDTIITKERSLSERDRDTSFTYTYCIHAMYKSRVSAASPNVSVRYSAKEIFSIATPLPAEKIAFDPRMRFVAAHYKNAPLDLWGVKTGTSVTISTASPSFNLSPQGGRIGAIDNDADGQFIGIWNADDGTVADKFYEFASNVFRFSPDGTVLAYFDGWGNLMTYNLTDRSHRSSGVRYSRSVWDMIYSPDGKFLVIASADPQIAVLEPSQNYRTIRTTTIPAAVVNSLAMSPDGLLLSAVCSDGIVRIWRFSDLSLIAAVPLSSPKEISFVAGTHQLTVRAADGIVIIDADAGVVTRRMTFPYALYSYALSPDGKMCAIAGKNAIHLWAMQPAWWTVPW